METLMDAEGVIEKILADARAEAERITGEAEANYAGERASLEAQLAEYRRQSETLAARAGEDRKQRLLANARMDLNKRLLATKRGLLDEVFAAAAAKLKSLDDKSYQELMTMLMLKAAQSGEEEVIVGRNESRIDQAFIKRINQQLSANSKGNLKLSEQRENMDGGFILKSGRIKVNVSVEVLLAQAREKLEAELAKELLR